LAEVLETNADFMNVYSGIRRFILTRVCLASTASYFRAVVSK
jgi:hypothetical protein